MLITNKQRGGGSRTITDIEPTKTVVLYNGPTRKSGKADGKGTNGCIAQKTWAMTLDPAARQHPTRSTQPKNNWTDLDLDQQKPSRRI